MALNNPAFNNPAFQDQRAVQTYPGGPQAATIGQSQQASAQAAAANAAMNAQLEGAFAAPPAGSAETGRMTMEDSVHKTFALFGILVVAAVVGWMWSMSTLSVETQTGPTMLPWIVGGLGGFVLSLAVIFTSRKKVRPGLIFAYAAFEGLFVGGISAFFEFIWPGIVVQATLGTLAVVGVTLALFASGKIRASQRATKIFMIAMVGYLVFSLLNVVLMWTGVVSDTFGMSSQPSPIFGIPWGVLIGVFVVILAAYSLVLDFDQIQQGVRNGAPREYGWLGAFGVLVTVVWLYVEILRIIAIARGD
ncbi:MAG: Bax inhibitor-1/YccA family protein [Microbacterium sp.]|uniref:Bax inhibitor-1/YccA family protein n=1 Tax=Microbacterium sp. TaxID=51671 RepID=UPI0039E5B629